MLDLAIRTACTACIAVLLAAAPAIADTGTGGLVAGEPPALSPAGGLRGPQAPAQALAARAGESPRAARAPTTTTPTTTTPDPPSGGGGSTVEVPVSQPPTSRPSATAAAPAPSGGGLPRTGFAIAGLVAIGTGFLLTGYALRYARGLDG